MWGPSYLTTLYASTACYRDSFTLLYVDDVRTAQETRLWTSTGCYRDIFSCSYVEMFVPNRKHAYGPPWPVTEIALLFHM
jgi:hypothetical protein